MILGAYARTKARSAQIWGLITLIVATTMIGTWGIPATIVLGAAGGLLLFGMREDLAVGPKGFLVYSLYVFLIIFGVGIGVT